METRARGLSRAVFFLAGILILGMAISAEAIEAVSPASVYPVDRVYPLVAADAAGGKPSAEEWAKAFPGELFFAKGVMETEGARTVFRMLEGKDRLHVRVECASRGTADKQELVEFHITQAGKPDFPCIAVEVKEDGTGIVGTARRAHTWWINPQVFPLDETVIPRQAVATEKGWTLEFSLPFDELDIPRDGFRFNVVHDLADGERFAWCDLGGREGTSNQFDVFARAVHVAGKADFPSNSLRLPAQLSVGLNRVALDRPEAGARLRIGEQVLEPKDGVFDVVVRDRGPLEMRLMDEDGSVTASYHADVRRPFIIDAKERYLAADAREFNLDIALDIAGEGAADVYLLCLRGGEEVERNITVKPGQQTVQVPIPGGEEKAVWIAATATVPLPAGAQKLTLHEAHWFDMGDAAATGAAYREGIRALPTERMYWAVLADAMPGLLMSQQGNGKYGTRAGDRWSRLWSQMSVCAPALLYKTKHPDNPYYGDRRLLASAVMGMEYALRPEIRIEEYSCPDSRSPQAFLLTYELLKDDIEPERREYWKGELEHIAEAEVGRFLRRITDKYTFFSIDCETSTNHMSFHVSNVYLAGCLFGREDWKQLGTTLMRRLARHGRDGYFEEQMGSPVNHYMWLTADALGQYYERSGDAEVLPTLDACARYMTAITTAQGQTMTLHDSRSSFNTNYRYGEFVLSRTPEGRGAARARLLNLMGNNPSRISGETLFRTAENAIYFRPGEEEDPDAGYRELPFLYGILVRKDGFHYGLSTVVRPAVSGNYVVDAQNAIEMFHKDAGCILHGGGSQSHPEAGNFWRKLDLPDWEGKTTDMANDYLPIATMLAAIPGGHELGLAYRTFEGNVTAQVLSAAQARVEVFAVSDKGPVTFSFFPGVSEGEEVIADPDGRSLRFRQVTFRANRPFKVEKGFRMLNPYNMQYDYAHKPVRCWLELKNGETFVLDIGVAPK